jgi:Tol biopolymer transport system component
MKLISITILASLVILTAACSSATMTPTSRVIPAAVAPPHPTPIKAAAANVQPAAAATVAPTLNTNGPYLAFLRDRGNGQELVLMDANGKGEIAFRFQTSSNGNMPRLLSSSLAPDGIYLAFYSGSAGQVFGHVGTDTADLTLNLMSLFNFREQAGTTKVITRLLSTDYPANFAEAAQQLGRPDINAQALQDTFVNGITQSLAWSPDGISLAFAGQMDGLSSDLYIYNAGNQSIQRLSSGPQQVQWVDWSPDGKWILNGGSYWVGDGMTYDIFATSPDGKVVRSILTDSTLDGDITWISGHVFLAYRNENGRGNYGLERVDIETGKTDKIWEGSFTSMAVDPAGDWLVVHTDTGELFLINLATLRSTRVAVPDPNIRAILSLGSGSERHFILGSGGDSSLYFLSTKGVLSPVGTSAELFSTAPNQQDWIAIQGSIQLFKAGNSQARTFNLPDGLQKGDIRRIIWRPDSSGIFLASSSNQLYALDFSSGNSALVERSLSITGPAGLIWVH